MQALWIAAMLCLLPFGAMAERAELSVVIRDGNPHDRIFIRNTGTCALVDGVLGLDFEPSVGRMVIDTAYGGRGTKDPMPVEVEHGPLRIRPVQDGDRQMMIEIEGLAPGQSGTVTFDVDNEASRWFALRVSILGEHLEGSIARFVTSGFDGRAVFTEAGGAVISMPEQACARKPPEASTVPMG